MVMLKYCWLEETGLLIKKDLNSKMSHNGKWLN